MHTFFKPRLLHVCWPMHDEVRFSHIWGWGGGGVTKASPLTVDRRLARKVTFLPVANSIMKLSKEPYR